MPREDDSPSTERGAGRRRRAGVFALLALSALAWSAWRYRESRRPVEWSGTVEARTISVGSRTGGRVDEVLAQEGDRVEAGAPLVRLEPGDLEARRTIAEGQVAAAEAQLARLVAGSRPEEIEQAKARARSARAMLEETRTGPRREEIAAARARLAAAKAIAEKTRRDAERMRLLAEQGAAARAELDATLAQARVSAADRDAAAQELERLVRGSRVEDISQAKAAAAEAGAGARLVVAGPRVEDIEAARAQVEIAQGQLQQIEIAIDELVIRAPRPARVESLDLRPGDLLAPSQIAATLVEEDQLYVRVFIPETQLGWIGPGQAVPVFVDAFRDRAFPGVVEHVASIGEFTPRNLQTVDERAHQVFAARVGLRDAARRTLRAGMAAIVRVPRPHRNPR